MDRLAIATREEKEEERKETERTDSIKLSAAGKPALQYYHGPEIRARNQKLIDSLTKTRPVDKGRTQSLLRNHNASKKVFKYPQHLYVDPKAALYEGTYEREQAEEEVPVSSDEEEVRPARPSVIGGSRSNR